MGGFVKFWKLSMSILWVILFLVITVITLIIYPFVCLFTLFSKNRLSWIWFNAKLISILSIIFFNGKVIIKGKENLPDFSKGKYCVVANHQSILDITALIGFCNIRAGFVAKAELRFTPILNIWLLLLHCVPLRRGSVKNTIIAMNEAVKRIEDGYQMVIFPEGTRSKTDTVEEFHPGSFKLAFRSKANILPIAINGTRYCAEDREDTKTEKIVISILPSVSTENLTQEERQKIPSLLHDQIASEFENIKKLR